MMKMHMWRVMILNMVVGGLAGVGFGQSGPRVSAGVMAAAVGAKGGVCEGPVEANWGSIKANYKVPAWFPEAKFGITMHWGLYSVAAYHNEWYEKYMYSTFADWHAQNFGPQDVFGYKDFILKFEAKSFDAEELVALVKASGAKYFMPTCEHHDGFSLWDSDANVWNAAKMGPKRDLIGEMAVAARKAGLKFGVCSHNMEHYTFIMPKAGLKTDLDDPKNADFYWTNHSDARLQQFLEQWVAKHVEIIDKYQPDIMWFDNGVNGRELDPVKLKVAAYYYNRAKQWNKEVTIDTKSTAFLAGSVLDFEKLHPRGPNVILKGVWEAEEPIGSTWGYSAANPVETFRNAQSVINLMAETLSLNGSLLLNLSPDGQGAINAAQRETLLGVGKWLETNGEAVYGSHNWIVPAENVGVRGAVTYRFTVKGEALYAMALSWPGETAVIGALGTGKGVEGKVTRVTLLGNKGELGFVQDGKGLKVKMPEKVGEYAYVLKIEGMKMNEAGERVPAVMGDVK